MNSPRLQRLLRPLDDSPPPALRIAIEEKISRAIERMTAAGCDQIGVVQDGRLVGVVTLADALRALGLNPAGG